MRRRGKGVSQEGQPGYERRTVTLTEAYDRLLTGDKMRSGGWRPFRHYIKGRFYSAGAMRTTPSGEG